jgi:hypothetical protein
MSHTTPTSSHLLGELLDLGTASGRYYLAQARMTKESLRREDITTPFSVSIQASLFRMGIYRLLYCTVLYTTPLATSDRRLFYGY